VILSRLRLVHRSIRGAERRHAQQPLCVLRSSCVLCDLLL
jgi:hypothetical protein